MISTQLGIKQEFIRFGVQVYAMIIIDHDGNLSVVVILITTVEVAISNWWRAEQGCNSRPLQNPANLSVAPLSPP
nr:hypothetical protein [Xenorhabdus bovienii]